jgi:hypothetical protein
VQSRAKLQVFELSLQGCYCSSTTKKDANIRTIIEHSSKIGVSGITIAPPDCTEFLPERVQPGLQIRSTETCMQERHCTTHHACQSKNNLLNKSNERPRKHPRGVEWKLIGSPNRRHAPVINVSNTPNDNPYEILTGNSN